MSEMTGPVFGQSDVDASDNDLIHNYAADGESAMGERIILHGRVLDENRRPVPNTLIEVWQANVGGRCRHKKDTYLAPIDPSFGGCARAITDEDGFRGWGRMITGFDAGVWSIDTIEPGMTLGRNVGLQAPHLNICIVVHGINVGLNTRMYFEDEADASAADPVLNLIEWETRHPKLTARRSEREGMPVNRFDVHLQGEGETVFFNI